ncbi:MAG: M42 family metallopeptidase [Candidatus Asgardarchaeia archaeon]
MGLDEKFLEELTMCIGPSGHEDDVRKILEGRWKAYADEVKVDRMGNLIAVKKGSGPKVMVAAHMDEIGMLVKYVDENGFVYFSCAGGFYDPSLVNRGVLIKTEKGVVGGIIGAKPPHLLTPKEAEQAPKKKDMFIDVGAKSREEASELGIKIGDPIVWDSRFVKLSNGRYSCKAFDDRIGCYILSKVLEEVESDAEIYFVGTVMEEVGVRGARTSAFGLNPDYAIAVDVTATGDTPPVKMSEMPVKLGSGPAIKIADGRAGSLAGGLISHPKIRKLLVEVAEKNKIPYQLEVLEGGTTDASAITLERGGIPSGTISIPSRYIHSPVEVIDAKDVENTIKLLRFALKEIEKIG